MSKSKLSSFGIFLLLTDSTPNNEKYQKLTKSEITEYEKFLKNKRKLVDSLNSLPNSFNPENDTYWDSLSSKFIIFSVIIIFPLLNIILLVFLKYILKICSGIKRISDINVLYETFTWIIFLISSFSIIIFVLIIFLKSSSINNSLISTLLSSKKIIRKEYDIFPKINEAVKIFRNEGLNAPTENYMENFAKNLHFYLEEFFPKIDNIIYDENSRDKMIYYLALFHIIIIILSYFFYLLKREKIESTLTIIFVFSLPFLFLIAGYNLKLLFFYSDFCESISNLINNNEFPIAEKEIGIYFNCLVPHTRAQLFNIRYKLYQSAITAKKDADYFIYLYNQLNDNYLQSIVNCEAISIILPKIEKNFCKSSLKNLLDTIFQMIFLFLCGLLFCVANRRLEVLIWKQRIFPLKFQANKKISHK